MSGVEFESASGGYRNGRADFARDTYDAVEVSLRAGQSGVRTMPEWDIYEDLQTRLGAPLLDFFAPCHYPGS